MQFKITINGLVEADNEEHAHAVAEEIAISANEGYRAIQDTFGVVKVEPVEKT